MGPQVISTFAAFLEDFLAKDNKGRSRIKSLERPEGTLTSITTAVNAAYSGAGLESPTQNPLIIRLIQQIIQQETKRPKRDKGLIDIPLLLSFLLASQDHQEEEKERLILVLVMGFTRIARLSDLFRLDRRSVTFSVKDGEPQRVTMHSLGEKTDKSRRGHPVELVKCSDPRICPVRLLRTYLNKTQQQAMRFMEQRPGRDRSPLPLFFFLNGEPVPVTQRSMESEIKKLLLQANMTEDARGRKITPGCIRISAREAAVRAGFPAELISAIGHWVHHTTQDRHYTPYDMPEDWTDKVLQPERL